jgi:hypothetical protein
VIEIQESEDITAPSPSESPPSSPAAGRVVEALKEAGGANDANETAVVIDGQTFSYQSFVVNDDKTLVTYYNSEGDAVFAQELENGEPTGNYLY